MNTLDKVKQKIKTLNNKNLIYYICLAILIGIFLFVLITTIIQTDWVGIYKLNGPILIWMISQPYVGVFFIPFLILMIYICCFIISVGKPCSIKKVKNDTRILFENNDIKKDEYETVFDTLTKAEDRKKEEEKIKQLETLKMIESMKSEINKGDNNGK